MSLALRRTLGGLAATLAALGASVCYGAHQTRAVVDSPDLVVAAADEALHDPAVADALARTIADEVDAQYAGALAFGLAPPAPGTTEQRIRAAVGSPAFAAEFAGTVEELHDHVFGDRLTVPSFDTEVLASSLDGILPPGAAVKVTIPTDGLPDLRSAPNLVGLGVAGGALTAAAFALLALTVHPETAVVVRRFGRWALFTGGVSVLSPIVGPRLVQALAGERGSYAAPFLDGLSGRFVGLGAAVAIVGVALLAAARLIAAPSGSTTAPASSPSPISLLLQPVPAATPTMRRADVPAPPAAAFPPSA
jgi:hypothetical protein